MELISIIMPVYNAEKYIARSLDSILVQDYENIELVIIDDGSKDSSADIVKEYCKKDPRIKYYKQENMGCPGARNTGLTKATGEYITFADADDYMEPNYCSTLLNGLKKYNAELCSCRCIDHHLANPGDDRAFPEDDEEVVIKTEDFSFFDGKLPKGVVSVLFKKSILVDTWFDSDVYIGDDTLFLARALHNAKKIVVLHKNLYHYIIYDESTCHGVYDKRKITEFTAWRRVARVFKDIPAVYETCRARYADRCLKVVRKYYFDMGVSEKIYKRILKEYRKNLKYIVKCTIRKHGISDVVMCMAYILFAVFPSLYPKYYWFRYHEKS